MIIVVAAAGIEYSQGDQETYEKVIDQRKWPFFKISRLKENYFKNFPV